MGRGKWGEQTHSRSWFRQYVVRMPLSIESIGEYSSVTLGIVDRRLSFPMNSRVSDRLAAEKASEVRPIEDRKRKLTGSLCHSLGMGTDSQGKGS